MAPLLGVTDNNGSSIVNGSGEQVTLTDPLVTDRELAQALLAIEMAQRGRDRRPGTNGAAPDVGNTLANGERVLQLLQEHLLGWFGPDGVDALLVRALERTRLSHRVLMGVQRSAPGVLRLAGIADDAGDGSGPAQQLEDSDVAEGVVALLTAILALIGRLVGDDMMRHLVSQIWPELAGAEPPASDSPNNNERSGN